MKNKLEFNSEACFKDIDVPKSSLEICRLCLALFKSVFFYVQQPRCVSAIFRFFTLLLECML